jgi:hypothetical protein
MKIFIIVVTVFLGTFSRAEVFPGTRTSVNGSIFRLVKKNKMVKALGEYGYKDEFGVIWGSPVKNENGEKLKMTLSDAIQYCKEGGAQLPSSDDLQQVSKYMGNYWKDGLNFQTFSFYTKGGAPIFPESIEDNVDKAPSYSWATDDGITGYILLAPGQVTQADMNNTYYTMCVVKD